MKYSIRTKVFVFCIVLIIITVGSFSAVSYWTAKKFIYSSFEKRIQVGFDIILNDLFHQIETFPRQIDEFLKQDSSLKRSLYVYRKTPDKINSILYVTGHLIKVTNELKKFAEVVSINRLHLYSMDGRLLAFYENFDSRRLMGVHIKSNQGNNAFLSLDNRPAKAEILYGSQPIPDQSLPEGIKPYLEEKPSDNQIAEMFSNGTNVGLKILTPVKYLDETVGILEAEVIYTREMIKRYARLSKTNVNLFSKSEFSGAGTLPLQPQITGDELNTLTPASKIYRGESAVHVSSVSIANEKFYQGAVSLWSSTEPIGGMTVSLSQNILEKEIKGFNFKAFIISIIIATIAFCLSVAFSRRTIRAIQSLTEYAATIAAGDLDLEIKPQTSDELGVLADSFSYMRNSIKENIRRLERLTVILETTSDIIAIVKPDGQITYMNKTGLLFFEWDTIENRTVKDALPYKTRKLIKETAISELIKNGIWEKETQIIGPDGHERPVHQIIMAHKDSQGNPGYFSSIIRDLTELKKTQEILIQNEKMLSVGGLAAGMAHEINNPLSGVLQNASVLRNRLTCLDMPANIRAAESLGISMDTIRKFIEERDIPKMINAITESGSRMASIVENMLNFSRKGSSSFSSYRLEDLMDRTLELASTDYDLKKQYHFKSISIQKEYEDNLPMILCEGSKIQQVLLNILNNGAYAMFDRRRTDKDYKPQFRLRIFYNSDDEILQLEIADNGAGMDEETRENIFQPFFTTKPIGEGTGLGLSVSYFIISENHQGEIDVLSEPGKGTTFIIRLPLHPPA